MNDVRIPPREPVPAGPGMLSILVIVSAGAFALRLLAAPSEIPPGALSVEALLAGEWWSVLTHIFIHRDFWHLLSNMVLLVLAGRAVERNAGSRHFLYILLVSAWAGAAINLCLRSNVAIIGASGGAWGVIGAFSVLHPEYDLMRPFRRVLPLQLKAKRIFPAFLIVHTALEIVVRTVPAAAELEIGQVAHPVHAVGLLTGWFYGRRLAAGGLFRDEWNDFFPQGLRRRFRERGAGGLPVAAGLPPRHRESDGSPDVPAASRELSDSEFLRERVDPVLEKLYANGADQLTAEERAVLEEASRRFSRSRS